MAFSPQSFLANVNAKEGFAKPNRFEVVLNIPPYVDKSIGNSLIEKLLNLPNTIVADVTQALRSVNADPQSISANASVTRYLALQCESAELPGKSLITADAKIYGPTYKIPYQTQYNETTLNFVCTNEFYERKLFEKWLESIMPTDTNNLRYPKGEASHYLTNIKIIQYDDFIRQIFAIELIDAFPIGIASQPLAWSEDGFHRLGIQFAYQKYRVVYNGNYDLVAAAAQLFGDSVAKNITNLQNKVTSPFGKIFGRFFN